MTPKDVFVAYSCEQNESGRWVTDYPPLEGMTFESEDECCAAMYRESVDQLMDFADNLRKAAKGG